VGKVTRGQGEMHKIIIHARAQGDTWVSWQGAWGSQIERARRCEGRWGRFDRVEIS